MNSERYTEQEMETAYADGMEDLAMKIENLLDTLVDDNGMVHENEIREFIMDEFEYFPSYDLPEEQTNLL